MEFFNKIPTYDPTVHYNNIVLNLIQEEQVTEVWRNMKGENKQRDAPVEVLFNWGACAG